MKRMGNNGNGRGVGNSELPSIYLPGLRGTFSASVGVGEMNYLNLFKKSGGV